MWMALARVAVCTQVFCHGCRASRSEGERVTPAGRSKAVYCSMCARTAMATRLLLKARWNTWRVPVVDVAVRITSVKGLR